MPYFREMGIIKARKRGWHPQFNNRSFRITTNDRLGNTKTYAVNEALKLPDYGELEAERVGGMRQTGKAERRTIEQEAKEGPVSASRLKIQKPMSRRIATRLTSRVMMANFQTV